MNITADDRFAIQDLYAAYCRMVDLGDAEGWADTFTEDGRRSLHGRARQAPGRQLADALPRFRARPAPRVTNRRLQQPVSVVAGGWRRWLG